MYAYPEAFLEARKATQLKGLIMALKSLTTRLCSQQVMHGMGHVGIHACRPRLFR